MGRLSGGHWEKAWWGNWVMFSAIEVSLFAFRSRLLFSHLAAESQPRLRDREKGNNRNSLCNANSTVAK